MAQFIVEGGKPLEGIYPVSGAKNAGPKLLIAALLTREKCVFKNIPRIADTFRGIDAITAIGGSVRFLDQTTVEIQCKDIFSQEIPLESMSARQAILLIGATLARTGHVKIYPPKGDAIGKRPLNRHLEGLKALGGVISEEGNMICIDLPKRPASTEYTFEKNTHMGTENLIVASVFNEGTVTLHNAAQEPEVDNLIQCLNAMGAKITRTEPRTIEINGVKPLLAGCEIASIYDRLESVTALVLSIMTGGTVKVADTPRSMIEPAASILEQIGVSLAWEGDTVSVTNINMPLKPTEIVTDWYPGFATDWQPIMTLLLATMASGISTIHERIFENRWNYLAELSKMGVKYDLFKPSGAVSKDYNFNDSEFTAEGAYAAHIYGPTELKPAEVISHDVRAGIDMLLASITAKGQSVIHDPQNHIDRGYENIVEKLTALGADIKRI